VVRAWTTKFIEYHLLGDRWHVFQPREKG